MGGDEIVLLVVTLEDVDPVDFAVLAVDDREFDAVCEPDEEIVELEPLTELEEPVIDAEFELLTLEPGEAVADVVPLTDVEPSSPPQ
jgi:hypothetical protein